MKTLITTIAILIVLSGCNNYENGVPDQNVGENNPIDGASCFEGVCTGQVWVYKSANPFSRNPVIKYAVLELKDGYVKYIDTEYIGNIDKYFHSQLVEYFKYGAECVSGPCK